MEKRFPGGKARRRLEWIILIGALAACLAAGVILYMPRNGAAVAIISVDGQEFRRIRLDRARDEIFSIEGETGKPVSFEVLDGAIRFVDVDCPDHICEAAGWCDGPGERAVCMPNRTTLICYAGKDL